MTPRVKVMLLCDFSRATGPEAVAALKEKVRQELMLRAKSLIVGQVVYIYQAFLQTLVMFSFAFPFFLA